MENPLQLITFLQNRSFCPQKNCETLKIKSLSSNEIFQADTPTVSRVGSITRLGRSKINGTTMDDSLTNISDFGNRPVSFHGSFEYLNENFASQNHINASTNSVEMLGHEELSYYCPFDSKCTHLIKGKYVTEHFQTNHTGPLVQYFGSSVEVPLKKLENEACFVISSEGNTFFIKSLANMDSDSQKSRQSEDIFIWCWHLGSKKSSSNFQMEVELKTKNIETPYLRVRSTIFSLNSTSFYDIKELKKGIFLSSKTIEALGSPDGIVLNINIISVDT